MTIIQSGNVFQLAEFNGSHKSLPVGVYLIKYNEPKDYYYLVQLESFSLPKKLYGDFSHVDRYIKAYNNTSKNLGVLLSGQKGGGKTITAQLLCNKIQLPIFILSQNFSGDTFMEFISSPEWGKYVLFIDEFEKVYREEKIGSSGSSSHEILQLMDGNFQTRILFLLTVNEMNISEYMVNRLGRIRYRKHFESMDESTINEVIDDLLINKDHKQSIFEFIERINIVTFDILTNVIKEMNLFNEDAITVGKHLNIEVANAIYDIYEVIGGVETLVYISYKGHPLKINYLYFNRSTTSHLKNKKDSYVDIEDIVPKFHIEKVSDKEFILKKDKHVFKFKKVFINSLVF